MIYTSVYIIYTPNSGPSRLALVIITNPHFPLPYCSLQVLLCLCLRPLSINEVSINISIEIPGILEIPRPEYGPDLATYPSPHPSLVFFFLEHFFLFLFLLDHHHPHRRPTIPSGICYLNVGALARPKSILLLHRYFIQTFVYERYSKSSRMLGIAANSHTHTPKFVR